MKLHPNAIPNQGNFVSGEIAPEYHTSSDPRPSPSLLSSSLSPSTHPGRCNQEQNCSQIHSGMKRALRERKLVNGMAKLISTTPREIGTT